MIHINGSVIELCLGVTVIVLVGKFPSRESPFINTGRWSWECFPCALMQRFRYSRTFVRLEEETHLPHLLVSDLHLAVGLEGRL